MSLQKQIALLRQAQQFYMFRDDDAGMRKYTQICDRLAYLYNQQEKTK